MMNRRHACRSKSIAPVLLALAVAVVAATPAAADMLLASYTFTGDSLADSANHPSVTVGDIITTADLDYEITSDDGNGNTAERDAEDPYWTTTASNIDTGENNGTNYFQFDIGPAGTIPVDFSTITFDLVANSSQTVTVAVRSDADSFASDLDMIDVIEDGQWATGYTLDISALTGQTSTRIFRVYLTSTSSGGKRTNLDNIAVSGSAIPEPASLTLLSLAALLALRRSRQAPRSVRLCPGAAGRVRGGFDSSGITGSSRHGDDRAAF